MEDFKDFQGKSLDDAIRAACVYYDAPREKLEIEIVQDAKSGIFGIVGARKAIIRARRTSVRTSVGNLLGRSERAEKVQDDSASLRATPSEYMERITQEEREEQRDRSERTRSFRTASLRPEKQDREKTQEQKHPERPSLQQRSEGPPPTDTFRSSARPLEPSPGSHPPPEADEEEFWGESTVRNCFIPSSLVHLDQSKLRMHAHDIASRLVSAILGTAPVRVNILEHRVDVRVDCGDDSGLLIGREGQTLSALQYLASRLVSRVMDTPVRVQFDVGDYRERQDERLRELAFSLAERVRQTGRPCSTRPMSSYHRRLVHMALQDVPDIFTRSTGEGPLKRIIIQRRRPDRPQGQGHTDYADNSEHTEYIPRGFRAGKSR